jgi:hypothetical protein
VTSSIVALLAIVYLRRGHPLLVNVREKRARRLTGVSVVTTESPRNLAVAHGRFQDLLTYSLLRVRGHEALDQAARQAEERRLAGAHAVERYQGADPAPLVAAELAVWALLDAPQPAPFFGTWR